MVRESFYPLADWGLFDIVLPFVLVFAIVYAVLQRTKVLGKNSKNYNTIVALVMGFAVVVPHVLAGTPDPADRALANGFVDLVEVINLALPQVSVLLIAILMVLLIFGIWGKEVKLGDSSLSGIIAFVSFLAVVVIFGNAAGWWYLPQWITLGWLTPETQALVITILVFAIIIWFVTREPKPDKSKGGERSSRFGKFFGSVLDDINE
ncbi:hypothetical protein D6789_03255 [Candidatus Woesearchaeota archaeon]|nr:MAG: hypothetical protein D6789_03255 [Candidatus Woesearchaeota archaeon]